MPVVRLSEGSLLGHTLARVGDGVDAHRLTPQNIVPLPEAKIDPPIEKK